MKPVIQIFDSFEAAEEAERKERWAMPPAQRLEILESLRSLTYPDGKTAPRLQRSLEVVEPTDVLAEREGLEPPRSAVDLKCGLESKAACMK